jgi:hypothetical protein
MKKLLLLIILLTSISCFSQSALEKKLDPRKEQRWALGTTFGYTSVVTPFNRNNFQLTMNLRYRTGPVTIGFQPGVNFTYETRVPDIRIGIRIQYDFLRW